MPAKRKKSKTPEDMLLRVMRVADILAKGAGKHTIDAKTISRPSDESSIRYLPELQKTQM